MSSPVHHNFKLRPYATKVRKVVSSNYELFAALPSRRGELSREAVIAMDALEHLIADDALYQRLRDGTTREVADAEDRLDHIRRRLLELAAMSALDVILLLMDLEPTRSESSTVQDKN